MRKHPWHIPAVSCWQSSCSCYAPTSSYTRSRDSSFRVPVWLQTWLQHNWHDIYRVPTTRKCCEQHCNLFFAFIDLTKAFDTVNRELLLEVLSKFGCAPHFPTILRMFYDGNWNDSQGYHWSPGIWSIWGSCWCQARLCFSTSYL